MSQLSQALAQASQRNHELLSTLSQTDYASAALEQNKNQIAELEKQIKDTERELRKLHQITEDERKDHVKYRDSTVKRFAYKMGGSKGKEKFATKSEKEEREFMEAWQKEREAIERKDEMTKALTHAKNEQQRFVADHNAHEQAQAEIDALYASIFEGPTPEVPGEDQLEQTVKMHRARHQEAQALLSGEEHAGEALENAGRALKSATVELANAHDGSTMDVWGAGGVFADMMERDALSRAQVALSECSRFMDDAIRSSPSRSIKPLSGVGIDTGHLMGDVFFDNIFSDLAQHDRIKESERQVGVAGQELKVQMSEQGERVKEARGRLQQVGRELDESRRELMRVRAEAFERVVGGGQDGYTQQQSGWGYGVAGQEQQGQYQVGPPAYSAY